MKLSAFKELLFDLEEMTFILPNGEKIPSHFHVTEVGQVTKHFVDCGGTVREEKVVNFQLWYSNDTDHRLNAAKLLSIISIAEQKIGLQDAEIEVEYQAETIGKYSLEIKDQQIHLTSKMTDCLAPDKCAVPAPKKKINLSDLVIQNNCTPGSGCC